VPLCPPQIPHDLTWDRPQAAAVGSQRLTAWAMARPADKLSHCTDHVDTAPRRLLLLLTPLLQMKTNTSALQEKSTV
jgi:hypothetical protein